MNCLPSRFAVAEDICGQVKDGEKERPDGSRLYSILFGILDFAGVVQVQVRLLV